jgi:5'-nucleotidase
MDVHKLKPVRSWRALVVAIAAGLLCAPIVSTAQNSPQEVDVNVFAINDVHGNLLAPTGGITINDPSDPSKKIVVPAGGAQAMATLIKQLRNENPNNIFVAAGDLVGASPLLSSLFHFEPTVESLSLMGLEASAVGNHEFDHGPVELKRLQNGGCHPVDGCQGPHQFTGAKFHYLAANTIDKTTGKTIFPPYYVKRFEGIPVAFIGLTLKGTPEIVDESGTKGLEFRNEADTVNALVPKLRAQGIEAIVVLIHEGGTPQNNSADYNGCPGLGGHIVDIVPKLNKAVDIVVSGHTHQAYNCVIDGRLVTSAYRYGTMVTKISLRLSTTTHDVIAARAQNMIVRSDQLANDPEQTQLISAYQERAAPIADRVVGKIAESLLGRANAAGESLLGDVIADAELAATGNAANGGAVLAFINSGGVRSNIALRPDGIVTYADLFAVQPFNNMLVTITLTGAQIKTVLEAQWTDPALPAMLQVSQGFTYTWDAARPSGDRVIAGSLALNGAPIQQQASYRVALTDFLAGGASGFIVFRDGKNKRSAMPDIDATEAYFRAHVPLPPPPSNRIQRLN